MITITAPNLRGRDGVFDQILKKHAPQKGEHFEVKERLSTEAWQVFQFN